MCVMKQKYLYKRTQKPNNRDFGEIKPFFCISLRTVIVKGLNKLNKNLKEKILKG